MIPAPRQANPSAHLFLLLVLAVVVGLAAAGEPRTLTFEARVAAQEAIERVSYSHHIGATKPFAEAVPRSLLEAKVRRYLKLSVALERFWNTPVTAALLDGEMIRIARHTRLPGRLREIYAALGHDPLLVRECYARQILVDRLAREFFAQDATLHAGSRTEAETAEIATGAVAKQTWDEWWGEVRESLDEASARQAGAAPGILPEPGGVGQSFEWEAGNEGGVDDPGAAGTESGALCRTEDTWESGSWATVPSGRAGHTAVWTGSVMVVWGGFYDDGSQHFLDTGGRYDPVADTWLPTSLVGAPSPRVWHTAVWTGSEMVAWGGYDSHDGSSHYLNSGGRYDPVADVWLPTSMLGAPSGRRAHTAVWTGSVMVVWGGLYDERPHQYLNTGGRYDPVADLWLPTATLTAPTPRSKHTAVWTGTAMVVWGGYEYSDGAGQFLKTGGRYDPATDSWRPTSTVAAPFERSRHAAVWTGSVMVVWGGSFIGNHGLGYPAGGRYDPVADTWQGLWSYPSPPGRDEPTAVWTGSMMVVWGGGTPSTSYFPSYADGGRYDPVVDTWLPVSTLREPSGRTGHTAVWTGSVMVVWGGVSYDDPDPDHYLDSGGSYAPTAIGSGDADGDWYSVCAGDCDDARPTVFPGAPEICDGLDNDCDSALPADEADADGDGVPVCAGDCDDASATTYPGALEVNDGRDNQCAGDPGYGRIDEISGIAGFTDPADPTLFCWSAQAGATSYQVVGASQADFSSGCWETTTDQPCVSIANVPASARAYYLLVRAAAPFAGSWGSRSSGTERTVPCLP